MNEQCVRCGSRLNSALHNEHTCSPSVIYRAGMEEGARHAVGRCVDIINERCTNRTIATTLIDTIMEDI